MSYSVHVKRLDVKLSKEYTCVSEFKNPFVKHRGHLSFSQFSEFVFQYSLFPKNIVSFFITAIYNLNYNGWIDVSNELIRNLGEELGQAHESVIEEDYEKFLFKPHYVILREGIFDNFGINIKQAIATNATEEFLRNIKIVLDSNNPSEVGGAVYALESSAVPELKIIFSLLQRYLEISNKSMSSELSDFFLFHIDEIEVGHRERLITNCSKYIISDKDMENFEKGFCSVLSIMEVWWSRLYTEITEDKTHEFSEIS